MADRGKLLTLDEVLQHVLNAEDEYYKPHSTDESSEEEYEPCERAPMLFVDEENTETVRYYKAVESNVATWFPSCCDVPLHCRCAEIAYLIQRAWKIEYECCLCSFFIYLFIYSYVPLFSEFCEWQCWTMVWCRQQHE